jgi:hypothetical protein
MSRAYPEFYITGEEIKKFAKKLKHAAQRLVYVSHVAN